MDYYKIGQRIWKYRKALGLSQEQLAELVGISTPHMSHIETGSTKLSLPVLVAIAVALGVRTDDLLFDHTDGTIPEELAESLNGCTPSQARVISDIVTTAVSSIKKHLP